MDYDTFDTDIFSEINDMPGEIYDVIEYKEEGEDDELLIEINETDLLDVLQFLKSNNLKTYQFENVTILKA